MFALKYSKGIFCDIWTNTRSTLGRMLREAGLEIDRKGAIYGNDIAHLEPFNRHRNVLGFYEQHPQIAGSAYVAPNATVAGDIFVGPNSYFGFGSVAIAMNNPIRVGANSKIGEGTVLETNPIGADLAYPLSVNIGNNVNIEHSCHLMSCIVDDDVHIGHKSVVMEGCQLERGCVIAPNSYVPAGSRIPSNTLWAGTPACFVRELKDDEVSLGEQSKEQIRLMEE